MSINGVIDKTADDLLRWGINVDFLNDGSFDGANEEYRTDIPRVGKIRGQVTESQMHRWDGAAWLLVNQP